MREGPEKRIDRLKTKGELRGLVAGAMREALSEVARKNDMGDENARAASDAVNDALTNDISTNTVEELREIAENAAEQSFKMFGFNDAKVMADLYVALDDELKVRTNTDKIG